MKLTKTKIDRLKYDGDGNSRHVEWDDQEPGFGVRLYPGGQKSFVLSYRIKGRKRLFTLGRYGTLTLEQAREKAIKKKGEIIDGKDPLRQRQDERQAPTVKDLAKRYLEEHAVKKRESSREDDKSMIDNIILPRLGSQKVVEIQYDDIDALHRKLKDTPYRANRVIALLSKMFSLASTRWKGWSGRDDNPAKGIGRYQEEKRQRYLEADELFRLSNALASHKNQVSANAIRLLMLTGARRNEVLSATWDQFDLNREVINPDTGEGEPSPIWVKPSAHTKQMKEHRIPISAAARQMLTEMQKTTGGDYLFPGRRKGEHLTEIKRFWASVCKTAKIKDCRIHDLRHTYASILASSGLSLPIIGALLGHTQQATTQRYSHLYDDPLREATERVGNLVTSNGETAEVVDLKKHGG